MKSTFFVKVIEKIQTIKKISFFVWDVSKDEHDEVLLQDLLFFMKIQTYLYQSCGNFLFKSHQDELGRSREGYSGNSDYGGVIRDGNGAVMWN